MVIAFENGQLGNQLFQYCALRKFKEESALFLIGMQSLKSMFSGVEISGSAGVSSLIERLICRLGKDKFDAFARKLRLIGLIEERRTDTGSTLEICNGILKNINYCDNSYFQSENMVAHSVAAKLKLKPDLIEQASKILVTFPQSRTATFFVHVRRGDYALWPSRSTPALLPLSWYVEQIDLIRSKYANPFFVVVSDDGQYAEDKFGNFPDVFVSHENEAVDFALMSLCDGGGVLSASTFSWWAAYFARRINMDALFLAPLYWGGHQVGEWYPNGIKTSWLNYVPVH